jgi:signal transduction histidine kinase
VEQLARELAAGGTGEADAASTALGLSRALGQSVWLLVEQRGQLRQVAASSAPASLLPSLADLRAAQSHPQLIDGASATSQPQLIASCTRAAGNDGLWVVRTELLDHAHTRWLSSEDAHDARFVDRARGSASREDSADVEAITLPGSAERAARVLLLRVAQPPELAQLLALAPLGVATFVLAGLLAYALLTRAQVDDKVLVELEQAAERVARGDLTARIGLYPGGRADQTFRTFDRMTAELSDMRTRLAEAERAAAWQDMARRIAHEIKNPLSPIRISIETLRKAHDKRLPVFDEIFDESTRAILEEVRRMEHIVREFSDFARLPRARPGALDLSALIADTLSLYEPADVAIELVSKATDTTLRADREQLAQVLVNLLQNATDAARSCAQPRVRVSIEGDSDTVWVHVDDNGKGIAPADRERVFEPYYTTKDHGTGLGLAIAKRIVFDHEGSITATDSPLGGARFTVKLPRQG